MATIKTKDGKSIELPPEVQASDLKYVSYDSKDRIGYEDYAKLGLKYEEIEIPLWYVNSFGWCMPTLLINRASRRARSRGVTTDRTYAISTKGQACRIGHGPHVLAEITAYVNKANLKRLMPLIEMRRKGEEQANETRDRISTRRMMTSMRRRSDPWF